MTREYKLPLVLAGGLFVLVLLILAVLLAATYRNSLTALEQERAQLQSHSQSISDLVAETSLERLRHIIDVTVEDAVFTEAIGPGSQDTQKAFLGEIFYNQSQGEFDVLVLLTSGGEIVERYHTELSGFPVILQAVRASSSQLGNWFWAEEDAGPSERSRIMAFYKQAIINQISGRVEGYLVGGVFLSGNTGLAQMVNDRAQADLTVLMRGGQVLATSHGDGEVVPAADLVFEAGQVEKQVSGYRLIRSEILSERFPEAGFASVTAYNTESDRSLIRTFVISTLLGLGLALLLSLLALSALRALLLQPLGKVMDYARTVGRQSDAVAPPVTSIQEFNEFSRTLENVFAAFLESEKRFADFASVSSDLLWETDADHIYTYLSRDPQSSLSVETSDLLGRRRWELSAIDLEFSDWEHHKQALEERQPFRNFIFRISGAEGGWEYWSVSGRPVYDNDNRFVGYRGTSTNITSEIEAQKEAAQSLEKLRQAQKMEIVGQLTGGVAHDFNNLLAVVLGNLELVEEGMSHEDPNRKALSDAIRAVEKGAALTHQLLAYSRQQTLKPVVVRPGEIVHEMQSLLDRALGETVTVRSSLNDSWSVLIDPNELENALLNLAVNGRDAMPAGGELVIESFDITIDQDFAEAEGDMLPGDYVCVVVTDTGEGIPETVRDKVLEPFFTTKEVGKGSGLGLSMVYGFVKQSGGALNIYSEIGQGTSIQLYLPKVKDADETIPVPPGDVIRGRGELVLVVEDNTAVRRLIVSQLKSMGYATLECGDGVAALNALEREPVDILLSDVTLPKGISGVEIVTLAEDQYPDMPKLLMSGFSKEVLSGEVTLPEKIDILYKPFTKIRFSEALSRAIKVRQAG
ncbi:ATP-binding protein [Sneathiella chinensis]|uniref:Autoinducer 2 sensor kinase/phosphatase LuxQ n=1 Tax=Sneathiella chinensis TaxID=349750 RepID=A0ABQ5U4P1_9PROT|nr:ATP-binding protein [Sneathiella chinensis]GLQ06688.1 hypothetical protein GCM10007924_19090 [Sneathiella chinensis]